MTTPKPSTFELELLEEVAGLRPARPWGAAVGQGLGYLASAGLITRTFGGEITPAGRAILRVVRGTGAPGCGGSSRPKADSPRETN